MFPVKGIFFIDLEGHCCLIGIFTSYRKGGGLLFPMAYISGSNMLYMKNSIQVVYSALLKRVTFLILQNTTKLPMSNNPHEFFYFIPYATRKEV